MAVTNNLEEHLRWFREHNAHVPVNTDARVAALAPMPQTAAHTPPPEVVPRQLAEKSASVAPPAPDQEPQRSVFTIDSDDDDDFLDLTAFSNEKPAEPARLAAHDVIFISSDDDDLDLAAVSSRSESVRSSVKSQSEDVGDGGLPDQGQPPPSWALKQAPIVQDAFSSLLWSDDECQVNGTPLNSELKSAKVQAPFVEDTGVKLSKLQAEKIGLLERKMDILLKKMGQQGIVLDTSILDRKLANLDREMANLEDDAILSSQDDVICDRINHLRANPAQEPSPYFSKPADTPRTAQIVDLTQDQASVHSTADLVPAPQTTQATKQPATPWHDELMRLLRTKFGIAGFRPHQLDAINATVAGKDVVVLMPTGGGKSLCYQLPALVTGGPRQGTTIVISPLISLMQDQIYHLEARNIAAKMLNSKLSLAERNEVMAQLEAGELKLLYLSPEMLNKSDRMRSALDRMHKQGQMARVVIDEAHCVSSWGHDFRTDYKDLMNLKTTFPGTPIIALTATANKRVLNDIFRCVGPDKLLLTQSFNRPNLFYSVLPKAKDRFEQEIIQICLKRFPQRTGIVYCSSKKQCEDLAERLSVAGVSTRFYHAGMSSEERETVQDAWQRGQVKVICATIAFGMGIDKGDVRFVVHATLPRNMEGYYQETGRAGRDGKDSFCFLFYSFGDAQTLIQLIERDRELAYDQRNHNKDLVRRVIAYCENKLDCRRVQVLQYFNEEFDARLCNKTCDNCINRARVGQNLQDVTAECRAVVNMVRSFGSDNNVTMIQCIGFLRGTRPKKGSFAEVGTLSKWDRTQVERIVHHLYATGVLEDRIVRNKMGFANSYVALGRAAQSVQSGKTQVKIDLGRSEAPAAPAPAKRSRAGRYDDRPAKRTAGYRREPAKKRYS